MHPARATGAAVIRLLSRLFVVGRLFLEVSLLPLVRRRDEAPDVCGLHLADLRHALQLLLGRLEDGADGSEPLEEVPRERLADVRQAFDEEPLSLPYGQRLRLVPEAVLGSPFVLALPEDAQDHGRLFLVRGRQDGDALLPLYGEEGSQHGLRMLER